MSPGATAPALPQVDYRGEEHVTVDAVLAAARYAGLRRLADLRELVRTEEEALSQQMPLSRLGELLTRLGARAAADAVAAATAFY